MRTLRLRAPGLSLADRLFLRAKLRTRSNVAVFAGFDDAERAVIERNLYGIAEPILTLRTFHEDCKLVTRAVGVIRILLGVLSMVVLPAWVRDHYNAHEHESDVGYDEGMDGDADDDSDHGGRESSRHLPSATVLRKLAQFAIEHIHDLDPTVVLGNCRPGPYDRATQRRIWTAFTSAARGHGCRHTALPREVTLQTTPAQTSSDPRYKVSPAMVDEPIGRREGRPHRESVG